VLTIELRHPHKALAYYARLEKLGDHSAELTYNLGWLLHDASRYEEAVDAYQHALELKPGLAEAELNLGHALHSLGRNDEAREAFERALAAKPALAV
jgi:tetratricopeptide (TPR) repeat protein